MASITLLKSNRLSHVFLDDAQSGFAQATNAAATVTVPAPASGTGQTFIPLIVASYSAGSGTLSVTPSTPSVNNVAMSFAVPATNQVIPLQPGDFYDNAAGSIAVALSAGGASNVGTLQVFYLQGGIP